MPGEQGSSDLGGPLLLQPCAGGHVWESDRATLQAWPGSQPAPSVGSAGL